ncbi:MAG: hypothetical protein LBM01_02530 [Christensenellaceae bacterium]|jgi:hypothetical protein|nr:hypothetical protein [Christensenellaceae bacterium]
MKMKRWGFFSVFAVAALGLIASFFAQPNEVKTASAEALPSFSGQSVIVGEFSERISTGDGLTRTEIESGVYIKKTEDENGIYENGIIVFDGRDYPSFKYEAVILKNGEWIGAPSETLSVAPLDNARFAYWALEKSAEAGHYGIRVVPLMGEPLEELRDESFYYNIVYVGALKYINLKIDGEAKFDLYENEGVSSVEVVLNMSEGAYNLAQKTGDALSFGNYSSAEEITASNMQFSVSLLGVDVSDRFDIEGYNSGSGARVFIGFPEELEKGEYIVRAYNADNSDTIGVFVIDNLGPAGAIKNPPYVLFLVLGLLAILGGVLGFFWPMISTKLAEVDARRIERNYLKINGAVIKKPKKIAASVKHEKANEEARIEDNTTLSDKEEKKSFAQMLAEKRQRLNYAREHGLTMEDLARLEAQQKHGDQDKKFSLNAFKDNGDSAPIVEVKETKIEGVRVGEEEESDILDSIEQENKQKTAQPFSGSVNAADDEELLARLKKLTED